MEPCLKHDDQVALHSKCHIYTLKRHNLNLYIVIFQENVTFLLCVNKLIMFDFANPFRGAAYT